MGIRLDIFKAFLSRDMLTEYFKDSKILYRLLKISSCLRGFLHMIIIACIDDNNGMMFNHRRQSQDRLLREHILNMIGGNHLWMNLYSKKQFSHLESARVIIDEDFLEKAGSSDYCFIEDMDVSPYIHKIEKIILFKWNRTYPADTFLPLDLNGWGLEWTEDFVGYSHDKITKEIYRR